MCGAIVAHCWVSACGIGSHHKRNRCYWFSRWACKAKKINKRKTAQETRHDEEEGDANTWQDFCIEALICCCCNCRVASHCICALYASIVRLLTAASNHFRCPLHAGALRCAANASLRQPAVGLIATLTWQCRWRWWWLLCGGGEAPLVVAAVALTTETATLVAICCCYLASPSPSPSSSPSPQMLIVVCRHGASARCRSSPIVTGVLLTDALEHFATRNNLPAARPYHQRLLRRPPRPLSYLRLV